MQLPIKRVYPAFFLTDINKIFAFLTLSYQSQKFVSLALTGVQLATGRTKAMQANRSI